MDCAAIARLVLADGGDDPSAARTGNYRVVFERFSGGKWFQYGGMEMVEIDRGRKAVVVTLREAMPQIFEFRPIQNRIEIRIVSDLFRNDLFSHRWLVSTARWHPFLFRSVPAAQIVECVGIIRLDVEGFPYLSQAALKSRSACLRSFSRLEPRRVASC
ncbi:MAG: hypothetical protein H7A53_09220 [Akkermansiaceae bacterium]|nr:hypothetical protein [Akkermansiaceae bacterium]